MTTVVAFDLSLTSTGTARIMGRHGLPPEVKSIDVGDVKSKPGPASETTIARRSIRLRRIVTELYGLAEGADLVLVEGPSFASQGKGTWDRAGLWWLTVGRLTGAGLNVVEVPPSSLKQYATGKGNAAKDAVLAAVVRRYPHVPVEGNDQADALVMAAMGARFAGFPIEESLPQNQLRAMSGVRWLPTN